MNTLLIVDDSEINRLILEHNLCSEYEILQAECGKEALEIINLEGKRISLILLDIQLPDINGFQVLEILKKKKFSSIIPVVLITGDKSEKTEAKCYELGAVDYITKPFDMSLVKNIIKNTIEIFSEKNQWRKLSIVQNHKLQLQTEQLLKKTENIIEMLGVIVEWKGIESTRHVQRVRELSQFLAQRVGELYPRHGINEEEAKKIGAASCLHDIGKSLIPDAILLKPGVLTTDEKEVIKSHTTRGCEMLVSIQKYMSEEYRQYCYDICRSHHERFDGNGYPDHLVGDAIPISAQIVSVAECLDSLLSDTVYRNAIRFDVAYEMILSEECGVFSPELMDCFTKYKEQIIQIVYKYQS